MLTDARGKTVGTFTLEFLEQPVKTCVSGEWRRAVPGEFSTTLLDLNSWYAGHALLPAYSLNGNRLVVQLNAPLCDNYTELRGTIGADRIVGELVSEHPFGAEPLSKFVTMKSIVQ